MSIKLSNLVRRQLPEFISTHYNTFASFLEKYYESLEITGQPLDILFNIASYYDINFYEKNLLEKGSNLTTFLSVSDTEIELENAAAFPDEYGYVKISDEICFYTKREGNTLTGVYRGVSGNTKLGDLYDKTEFASTQATNHNSGTYVQNISNLFLFAILKSFESQYLANIPEKYLNDGIDKRTLIKNITDFYKSKGSEKSIQFIFNSLISTDQRDEVSVRRPSDLTFRSSTSDWITSYKIKIDVISGNPKNLIGAVLEQSNPYAYGIIEFVEISNNSVDLIIDPTSTISEFKYYGFTKLLSNVTSLDTNDFTVDVVSTGAWKSSDTNFYIGSETFFIDEKNVNQFRIKNRSGSSAFSSGSIVYLQKPYDINGVKFNITGSVYNLTPKTKTPYSSKGDPILVSKSTQSSFDPIVYNSAASSYRWIANENRERPVISTKPNLQNQLTDVNANVSAILEDETYFYVCSSGYPSFDILSNTLISNNNTLSKNDYLKLIRKSPVFNAEVYEVDSYDAGILVDGSLIYSKKSDSFVSTGPIVKVAITNKGSGYKNPPVVLINNSPSKASSILSGNVVSEIKIATKQSYKKTPTITITSGRNGLVEPVVTNGELTSFIITNPGEYYVSPPKIVVRDLVGRGKFAECRSVISSNGKLVAIEIINGGKNYTSDNIRVDVVPQGDGAQAEIEIKKWYYNRYNEITSSNIDSNGGSLVNKKFDSNKTYAVLSNPKRLRYEIGDNINSILSEQPTQHSQIIGFCYDGYPIYGPYGYLDPLNNQSSITRMRSGYTLNTSRENGPSVATYPLGNFDEDYTWTPNVNSGKIFLDQNNGRYCVTPEYPNGTYAYFVTINSVGVPVYPYILGKNYYGIPVDSNYNKLITQSEIPRSARILDFSQNIDNGVNFSAIVTDVENGAIDGFIVDQVTSLHNPGNIVFVDNSDTDGEGFSGSVESVFGESIEYINSKNSVCNVSTEFNAYLFDQFVLRERISLKEGTIVGDVLFSNNIILENVASKFDGNRSFDMIDPATDEIAKVLSIFLSKSSVFTQNAILSLTDGFNRPDSIVATGRVLETTSNQNTVRVLVLSGDFNQGVIDDGLFLQSSVFSDSLEVNVVSLSSLSENILPININYNYAIVKTESNHNLSVNDSVNISINPNDSLTEKTFYVRKRLLQELKLRDRKLNAKLIDTGIGKLSILTSGSFRSSGIFNTTLGNASVRVTITNGYVANIEVLDKGSNFVEDQILRFNAVLVTDPLNSSKQVFRTDFNVYMETNSVFVCRVDHVGVGLNNTKLKLSNVKNVSEEDFLSIGEEIVKVTSVNYLNSVVSVERAQKGTSAAEHFDGAEVSFDNFVYRFTEGSFIPELGTDQFTSPKVYSYDVESNILLLYYQYGVDPSVTTALSISSFIKDESSARKDVLISSVGDKIFKLEFSNGDENNFVVNPNIDIQNYYKYTFKTGHPSMSGTYLDFSPSLNYNLVTQEKYVGPAEPGSGSANSFVSLKFGFGPRINSNTYTTKVTNRFSNYYYFIVASGVFTDNARLSLIEDPLSGPKVISYTTNNKFVYEINSVPQENGTGEMLYTTSSSGSTGLINTLTVDNFGKNYIDVPVVIGVEPARSIKASLEPVMNNEGGIVSFTVNDSGSGYVNPKIILIGNGKPGNFSIALNQNGGISNVNILNPGGGYSDIPKIYVVDSTNKIYLTSKNIGIPRTIEIVNSGKNFTTNNSTLPFFTSTYAVLLSNIGEESFGPGKIIEQYDNYGNVIFVGRVTKKGLRTGSNIVRFESISGRISKDYLIGGANIVAILFTDYEPEIKSFYDKSGYFSSEKGFSSSVGSNLTDSYFYQDYSYLIRSKTPIDLWRSLIKDVVHPAGFQLFGEVVIEADTGIVDQPTFQAATPIVITINAGVESVYTINTRTIITEIIETVTDTNVQRGVGRLHFAEFTDDFNEAKEIYLSPDFDGYVDPDTGISQGTKIFTMLEKGTGIPVSAYDETSVIVSLSNVIQEPKKSYTINGSQIIFAKAPLGDRTSEGQSVSADNFIGRIFKFKDLADSQKYFKKVKNIFQRSGIWLDSANQIGSNKNFIVEETFGYITTKYPLVNFNSETIKSGVEYIIKSFEHDIRFGGNSAIVAAAESYLNVSQIEEIKDAYQYAAKLCAAAIRNWDVSFIDDLSTPGPQYEVIISASSDIITVPSTFGIVEGMYISSGSQFPVGTKVIEIIDETNVRVSANSFSYISENGNFIFEVPIGEVILPPVGSTEVQFNYNGIVIQTDAELIVSNGITVTITSNVARLRQVRFSLSRINTGTFVDASNLIFVNRRYIINETISYINSILPSFSYSNEIKCRRDIAYLIDAVIYHLRYGGNDRLVDYAEKYYFANKLNYINDALSETIAAFEYSIALMIDAIENPGAPYETVGYDVSPDVNNPLNLCAEVKSAINSYKQIYTSTLENGPNLIDRDFGNVQKSGNYTNLLTYSNYNIIENDESGTSVQIDGVWFAVECANVISSLYNLSQSVNEILDNGVGSVDVTIPDYFDGVSKAFELYTDDGNILKSSEGEDLLVFMNGILQRPTAYKIIRSPIANVPDLIEFSEAPRWDQSKSQLLLNEATAVDYFHAFSIGVYSRRTIDEEKISYEVNHDIITYKGLSIDPITDPKFHLVFVDGVLQRNAVDYVIQQTRILFNKKLNYYKPKSGEVLASKVDIISFQGEKNLDNFIAFDFQPGAYAFTATFEIYNITYDDVRNWDLSSKTYPIDLVDEYGSVGRVLDYVAITSPYQGVRFTFITDQNRDVLSGFLTLKKDLDIVNPITYAFADELNIITNTTLPGPEEYIFGTIEVANGSVLTIGNQAVVNVLSSTTLVNYEVDESNEKILKRAGNATHLHNDRKILNESWRTLNRITANILEGDLIKVDGENNYREILKVPDIVKTSQNNLFVPVSRKIYGNIVTSISNEKPRGSGLNIIPYIDVDGKITYLDYNKADYIRSKLLQVSPKAIGIYPKEVFIDFLPVDGNGGGAIAKAIIFGNEIIDVTIINPGYGYTQPPTPFITRGFDIIKSHRNVSPTISKNLNIVVPSNDFVIFNEIVVSNPNISTDINIYVDLQTPEDVRESNVTFFLESQFGAPESIFSIDGIPQEVIKQIQFEIAIDPNAYAPETFRTLLLESNVSIDETESNSLEMVHNFEDSVSIGDTLRFSENLNFVASLVTIDFLSTDTILYVTNTAGFAASGVLQVGQEIVEYSSKLPDRFIIQTRGYLGSTIAAIHPIGTSVSLYLTNINYSDIT